MTRRDVFRTFFALSAASLLQCADRRSDEPFRFCLNTSTINGSKLGLLKALSAAASAGFRSVEIWVRDVQAALQSGASVRSIAAAISDLGLTIENAIDFPHWLADDEAERREALTQLRATCELLVELGCRRIALPPAGMTSAKIDLNLAAARFAEAAETVRSVGLMPQLEIWGFSANVGTLGDALYIVAQSGIAQAGILADVYHLHRGGTPFTALTYVAPSVLQIFHLNDFPTQIPREQLKDADRLFPGDGAAPWPLLKTLLQEKAPLVLSLELFSPALWQLDPQTAAEIGLKKMRQVFGL
ncbi:MAG: sugar phosphate isomerase/epimerase [candidate division KSB1 bacterium]|nr:sugar phosphate isomerase/epimerase [candidate division KSB1 bacterium]